MKRREFIRGLAGAAAWPIAARAQPSALPVIGFLCNQTEMLGAPIAMAFRQGLAEQGYLERRNVEILYRWSAGPVQVTELAAELVRRRVAVIVTPGGGTAAALAAKSATTTIPIVFAVGSDPVEAGLVASLSHPGGNVTGATRLVQELTAKHIELLHKIVPSATLLGCLLDPRVPYFAAQLREAENAAPIVGVRLVILNASTPTEIEKAFATFDEQRIGALLVGAGVFYFNQRNQLTTLATRRKIPTMYPFHEFTSAGGLMSYGTNDADADRLAGIYAGRILKGEKPGDLPVQQPTTIKLILNLKAAKAIGLEVPTSILLSADEVIE